MNRLENMQSSMLLVGWLIKRELHAVLPCSSGPRQTQRRIGGQWLAKAQPRAQLSDNVTHSRSLGVLKSEKTRKMKKHAEQYVTAPTQHGLPAPNRERGYADWMPSLCSGPSKGSSLSSQHLKDHRRHPTIAVCHSDNHRFK
jgi:hypothetical protein